MTCLHKDCKETTTKGKTKMNKQDRQVVAYPKDRSDGIEAVAKRLANKAKQLTDPKERATLDKCIMALKLITPGPRVSRILGEFLVDMANEQDRQDRKYGTDSNNPNYLVPHFITEKKP
jgi:hypothetical protein